MENLEIKEVGTLDQTYVSKDDIIGHVGTLWPVYGFVGIYKVYKFIIQNIEKLMIPVGVLVVAASNYIIPKYLGQYNSVCFGPLANILKVFNKKEFIDFLAQGYPGSSSEITTYQMVLSMISFVLIYLIIYLSPAVFVALWVKYFGSYLADNIHWEPFDTRICMLKLTMQKKRELSSTTLIKDICMSLLCIAMLVTAVIFIPEGIKYLLHMLSVSTGYGL